VPGFLSFNLHLSLDRTQILKYGQCEGREALAAARENPKIVALMSETAKIAVSSKPIPYELRKSEPAPSKHPGLDPLGAAEKPPKGIRMYDLRLADCVMVLCRYTVAAIDKAARFCERLG
jgi:hypothetical protein